MTQTLAASTLRRSRQNRITRALTREYRWHPEQFIQPYFVVEGISKRQPIPGLGETHRDTPESLLTQIEADLEAGVQAGLLFGVPSQKKDRDFHAEFTARQIDAVKRRFGRDFFLGVDVCVCSLSSSGHCGVLSDSEPHVVENERSVAELARLAGVYAQAGADLVAPSDMMDGRIAAIRNRLDLDSNEHTVLMSYAAKFNSRFYGPFRVAADSAPKLESRTPNPELAGRATYQIDPSRPRDALLSAQRDADEGADWLMVKPGLPYLDQLKSLSDQIALPWAVYEVSGEFASVELLAREGLIDADLAHAEAWTAFVRSGAQMIISYGARRAKRIWLHSEGGGLLR